MVSRQLAQWSFVGQVESRGYGLRGGTILQMKGVILKVVMIAESNGFRTGLRGQDEVEEKL